MPPKNVAAPNAVKLFNCKICDKGYPRQTEYENHLRSYDHNHRQRLAEMKKITAANDSDSTRTGKRGLDEMRSIPVDGGAKIGLGRGFRKVGVDTSTGGGGFKKVGVAAEGAPSGFKKVGTTTSVPAAPSGFKKVGVAMESSGSVSTVADEAVPSPPAPPVSAKAHVTPLEDEITSSAMDIDTAPTTIESSDVRESAKDEVIKPDNEDVAMVGDKPEIDLPRKDRPYDPNRPSIFFSPNRDTIRTLARDIADRMDADPPQEMVVH